MGGSPRAPKSLGVVSRRDETMFDQARMTLQRSVGPSRERSRAVALLTTQRTPIDLPISMHRLFTVDDILIHILSILHDPRNNWALRSPALKSNLFFEPCMSIVWRTISSPNRIFETLPADLMVSPLGRSNVKVNLLSETLDR